MRIFGKLTNYGLLPILVLPFTRDCKRNIPDEALPAIGL
jgi:hypothetical protein